MGSDNFKKACEKDSQLGTTTIGHMSNDFVRHVSYRTLVSDFPLPPLGSSSKYCLCNIETSNSRVVNMSGNTKLDEAEMKQRQSVLSGIGEFIAQSKTWLDNTMEEYGFTKEHLFQKVSIKNNNSI